MPSLWYERGQANVQAAAAVGAEGAGSKPGLHCLLAAVTGADTKCRMDIAVDLECTYERECY